MNLAELIADLRLMRLDDAVEPYLWSDEQLTHGLNDAVRQFCLRQRALMETTNPAICQIQVAQGQRVVQLHPSIIAVRFAYPVPSESYVRDRRPTGMSAKRMFKHWPHWDCDPEPMGELEHWVPDYQEGCLALYPLPHCAYTLQLSAWRMPLESELLDPEDPDSTPVISPHWHQDLGDWAAYRALNKPDADTYNPERAKEFADTFTAKAGRLPTAVEVRLWGISPIVGVRPQFL